MSTATAAGVVVFALAHGLKTVARVQRLRARVAGAHFQPQRGDALALRPVLQRVQQALAMPLALVRGGHADAQQMPVIECLHGNKKAQQRAIGLHQHLCVVARGQRIAELAQRPRVGLCLRIQRGHGGQPVGAQGL